MIKTEKKKELKILGLYNQDWKSKQVEQRMKTTEQRQWKDKKRIRVKCKQTCQKTARQEEVKRNSLKMH